MGAQPVEREGRDLRRSILTAARRLFIDQGYHALSMRQIAAAVGVSKPALYYHFGDKEHLFQAVILDQLAALAGLFDGIRAQGGPARWQIASLVRQILALPPEQRAVIRLASQEVGQLSAAAQAQVRRAYDEKFLGQIRSVIATGSRAGELRQVDPEVATWALLGMMYPYFYQANTPDVPLEAVADQLLVVYLDGLAEPPPGQTLTA